MKAAPLWKILSYTLPAMLVTFNFFVSEDILYALDLIQIVGDGNVKSTLLGFGISLATFCALIVGYISGVIMDKTGLSLFLIAFGLMSTSIFLLMRPLLMSFLTSTNQTFILIVYISLLVLGKCSLALFVQPHMTMMQHFFPKKQFGTVGGLIGFSNMAGALIGLGLVGLFFSFFSEFWWAIINTSANLVGIIWLLPAFIHHYRYSKIEDESSIEVKSFIEDEDHGEYADIYIQDDLSPATSFSDISELAQGVKYSWYQKALDKAKHVLGPLIHRNFSLICFMSFFAEMGFVFTLKFQVYYFNDMVALQEGGADYGLWIPFLNKIIDAPEKANALFGASVTIPSLLGALVSGPLSDKFGKKSYYLLMCCYLLPLFKIVDVLFHNLNVTLILGLLQGFLVGVYFSLEMAIMQEYLPSKQTAGRDTAVFSLFKQSPQFLATLIGGVVISLGNQYLSFMNWGGYVALYFISALFHLISFVCILLVN